MVSPSKEEIAVQREKSLDDLIVEINARIMDSETQRDACTLAVLLMIKSLDILAAHYPGCDLVDLVIDAVKDRQERRQIPVTAEYAARQAAMDKWLP